MSDDTNAPRPHALPPADASVLAKVIRAYDRVRTDHASTPSVSDFRLDLSPSRREELDSERAATHLRMFQEG